MRATRIALAIILLGVAAWPIVAEEQPKPEEKPAAAESGDKRPTMLMRKKLEYSQKILEGLSVEDFEMIRKNAKLMNTFAQLENWFWADTPQYRAQLNIFRFANDEMIRMAEEKNLEGVSLAYTQMTLSCVNCHKQVRDKSR